MAAKMRLDLLLIEKGFFSSREKAKAAIMAGEVLVENEKATKAGSEFAIDSQIRLLGERLPYVSRGGLKLAKALTIFPYDIKDKIMLDIGASTGGFVDCALQNGAQKVYAVDVGYNQLAWSLRNDQRVVCLEKTNARYLDNTIITEKVDIITADVAFISLTLALPAAIEHLLKDNGALICLIKPQFEAGKENVGKKGVVRDQNVHKEVISKIIDACQDWQLAVQMLDYSPITGPNGNIEYLLFAEKNKESAAIDIDAIVDAAWQNLH